MDELEQQVTHDLEALQEARRKQEQLEDQMVLPPELQKAVDEYQQPYREQLMGARLEIDILNGRIMAGVLALGRTVKGAGMQAIFNRPRVTWDTKKLEGMAILLPQINEAKKQGEAYVTIREVQP
jgi:hypothetical protein